MAISELKGSVVTAKLWAPISEVESQALDQIRNVASLPWVAHVSVMADMHYGIGSTIGSVVAMRGAVSAAMIGVDIGCGVGAIRTSLSAKDLPDSLANLRSAIEAVIPVGFNSHEQMVKPIGSLEALALQNDINKLWAGFEFLDPHVQTMKPKALRQLGTLGGGNHYIELCLDTEQHVWMMLHSGSRNIGKELAEIHIWRAKQLEHNASLPDKDLAVFLAGTPEMAKYRSDLYWAQNFAMLNRRVMFELYKNVLRTFFPQIEFEVPVLCHHNYLAEERHFGEDLFVTRKGAINASVGQMGVIPGSMGTKSYVVRGLGDPESLNSASHGAGRKMSRGVAKRHFTVADLEAQTLGVECRKDIGILDEIPGAYKDIDQVMRNQSNLVEIVAELKAVLCVKG